MKNVAVDVGESVIQSLIETIGAQNFCSALNNASCHGKAFLKNEGELLDDDDKFLNQWFQGIEQLLIAVKTAQ